MLASAGLASKEHADPAAFFDVHDPRTPGCLILDLALPGTSGLAVQQKMRTLGLDLPIVFLSGCAAVSESVQAMKDGAIDFLTKPVDADALLDAVQRGVAIDQACRARVAGDHALAAALETLTPREREMLPYLVAGRLNKQVASDFGVVEKTVKVHRGRVMFKFGTRSLVDLVRIAERLHIEPKGGRFSAPSNDTGGPSR
jgi:FixJ family two-component response regulator